MSFIHFSGNKSTSASLAYTVPAGKTFILSAVTMKTNGSLYLGYDNTTSSSNGYYIGGSSASAGWTVGAVWNEGEEIWAVSNSSTGHFHISGELVDNT